MALADHFGQSVFFKGVNIDAVYCCNSSAYLAIHELGLDELLWAAFSSGKSLALVHRNTLLCISVMHTLLYY